MSLIAGGSGTLAFNESNDGKRSKKGTKRGAQVEKMEGANVSRAETDG